MKNVMKILLSIIFSASIGFGAQAQSKAKKDTSRAPAKEAIVCKQIAENVFDCYMQTDETIIEEDSKNNNTTPTDKEQQLKKYEIPENNNNRNQNNNGDNNLRESLLNQDGFDLLNTNDKRYQSYQSN